MSHYAEGVRRANAVESALKQLKHYGYGIVDKKGPAFGVVLTKASAEDHIRAYIQAGKTDHRVVELFYKEAD